MHGQNISSKFMLWIMFSQYVFSEAHAQGMDVVADNNITKVATKIAPSSTTAAEPEMAILTPGVVLACKVSRAKARIAARLTPPSPWTPFPTQPSLS